METAAKSTSSLSILLQIFFFCISWKIYYSMLYLMDQHCKAPGCSSSFFKFHCLVRCWQHSLLSSFDLMLGMTNPGFGSWLGVPCHGLGESLSAELLGQCWARACPTRGSLTFLASLFLPFLAHMGREKFWPGASLAADCASPLTCVKDWDDLVIHAQNNYSKCFFPPKSPKRVALTDTQYF